MRALDLFCGAGGASMGLHRAGFDVTGVDLSPQRRYPFRFVHADALTVPLDGYDLIWASPPCQHYSKATRPWRRARHIDAVARVRTRLADSGAAWVIENVPGAPLHPCVILCGSMFGLGVRRHRLFETNFLPLQLVPPCNHRERAVAVNGHAGGISRRDGRNSTTAERRTAMGIDWMASEELSQAIPPAYSEFLARTFLRQRQAA
jgi:DNA (cytosine-5)-methyltransferase 1